MTYIVRIKSQARDERTSPVQLTAMVIKTYTFFHRTASCFIAPNCLLTSCDFQLDSDLYFRFYISLFVCVIVFLRQILQP